VLVFMLTNQCGWEGMYALDHFMYRYIVLDNKHGVIWVDMLC
jgi:hypothetical protein